MSGDMDASLFAKLQGTKEISAGQFNASKNFLLKRALEDPSLFTLMRDWIFSILTLSHAEVVTLSCVVHGQEENADCLYCLVLSDRKGFLYRLSRR